MKKADKIIVGVIATLVVSGWLAFARVTQKYTPPGALQTATAVTTNSQQKEPQTTQEELEKELKTIEKKAPKSQKSSTHQVTENVPTESVITIEEVPPASPTLYTDTMGVGWAHIAWSNTEVTLDKGIYVTTTKPWGRLILQAVRGFSTQDYGSLVFNISSQQENTEELYIALNDSEYEPIQYVKLSDYTGTGILKAGTSYAVAIPLDTLNPERKEISELVLESASPNTFFIDTIAFSTQHLSTFWEKPAVEEQENIVVEKTNDPVIFSDSFNNNWHVSGDSWDATFTNSNKERFGGQSSLEVKYTDVWGTFILEHLGGLDTTGWSYISFGAHGGTNGNQQVDIIVYDLAGNEIGRRPILDGDRLLAGGWKNIRIPLYRLGAENTTIGSIAFQVNESSSLVYFDDIQLSN